MTRSTLIRGVALLFSIVILMPVSVRAEDVGLRLLSFRLDEFNVFQAGGSTSYSAEASWNPYYGFGEKFGISGNFGAMPLKAPSGDLFAFEYEALISYELFGALGLEAGGGGQTWVNGGTACLVTGGAYWRFSSKFFGILDRIVADYSALLISGDFTNEVKVGVGISF